MNAQVSEYINNAPEVQSEIMAAIRQIIHQSVEGVTEEYKWSRPVFRLDKDFAYLQKSKNHVTLGFFNFEKINDKENQLEGSGKQMRHIKLKSTSDIDDEKLKEWFTAVTAS